MRTGRRNPVLPADDRRSSATTICILVHYRDFPQGDFAEVGAMHSHGAAASRAVSRSRAVFASPVNRAPGPVVFARLLSYHRQPPRPSGRTSPFASESIDNIHFTRSNPSSLRGGF
jgi:hypothetical protein